MAKVLVIGNGGREHALLWKLSQSPKVASLFIFPGNGAIESATNAKCADIKNVDDHPSVIDFCRKQSISLVVVGPEQPLANGIVDSLIAAGIACFGPSAKAARIESSKAFAKEFMIRNGIPTARFRSFSRPEDAKAFLQNEKSESAYLVVKASGLALGKGVVVTNNRKEAIEAVDYVAQFGSDIILEEKLMGEEVSALCFTDGHIVKAMPFAQDHKRLLEDDQGPNTGGMGAFAPYPFVSSTDKRFIENEILLKTIVRLKSEGIEYKGVLYAGLMLTEGGPKVLEFNCRFGDPETQVLIPLLRSDLYEILEACLTSRLKGLEVVWADKEFACGVALASRGYPNSPETGFPIEGLEQKLQKTTVFYAGAKKKDDGALVTSGGRVLCAVGVGDTLADAATLSLTAAKQIRFDGRQFRNDIGRKVLKRLFSGATLTYANAGVDINAGDALVESIKAACASTSRPGSDGVKLGGFGAIFDLRKAGFKDPILVSGTDGVGTKLTIAQECGLHQTIGIDLVAMCVNDILTQAAEPLFFLDYYATGKLSVNAASSVVRGIAAGCKEAGCALIGGETAEMPGFYSKCEYDLAGFSVGAVERENVLDSSKVSVGDLVLGLPSSGLHSNGFSLVRKIVQEKAGLRYSDQCPWDSTISVGRALLAPTKIYVREILKVFQRKLIEAAAHITGGGLTENIPRVLPSNTKAMLDIRKWPVQKVFTYLQEKGRVPSEEMIRTFNCGIGFVLIISPDKKDEVKKMIQAENGQVFEIGRLEQRKSNEKAVEISGLEQVFTTTATNGCDGDRRKKRVAVLISGSGTNLQALIDYQVTHSASYEIALVISNVPDVEGLERAQRAGILTKVITHQTKTREVFEDGIHDVLVKADIEFVCLAGFMRILTENFVKKWTGRMINVHPSLLPSFKGAHAHKLVLESGVRVTGCSVHFVEPEVDAGAIILQGTAPVYQKDTEETLSERVKLVEHQIYPRALDALAKGHVRRGENGKAQWNSDEALESAVDRSYNA